MEDKLKELREQFAMVRHIESITKIPATGGKCTTEKLVTAT